MVRKRIASLLASGTEILHALGLGDSVVAVSHECDYPEEARDTPRVTFARVDAEASSGAIDAEVQQRVRSGEPLYEIDVQRLAELRPDLIVTQSQCDVCAVSLDEVRRAVEEVEGLWHTRIVSLNPTTLNAVFEDILRVGDAAGVPGRAAEYVAALRRRVEAVRSETAKLSLADRPRVACIEWIEPLMLAANWVPELIEIAGGRCDLTKTGVHSTFCQWEELVAYDPEVITISPCGFDLPRTLVESKTLAADPHWGKLSAVRTGRVFAVDGNAYFNRSGPRLVDSLELLAQLVHPGRFPAGASQVGVWANLTAHDASQG